MERGSQSSMDSFQKMTQRFKKLHYESPQIRSPGHLASSYLSPPQVVRSPPTDPVNEITARDPVNEMLPIQDVLAMMDEEGIPKEYLDLEVPSHMDKSARRQQTYSKAKSTLWKKLKTQYELTRVHMDVLALIMSCDLHNAEELVKYRKSYSVPSVDLVDGHIVFPNDASTDLKAKCYKQTKSLFVEIHGITPELMLQQREAKLRTNPMFPFY